MKAFIFTVDAIFALVVAVAATSLLLYLHPTAQASMQGLSGEAQSLVMGMLGEKIGNLYSSGIFAYASPYLSGNGNMYGSFDGSSSYVNLGNPTDLQITGSMTISMWVYPTSFANRENPYCKAYGGEGCITEETSGHLTYYYGTCGGDCSPYQGYGSSTGLKLNAWNYVVISRNLTSMKLNWYVNGVASSTGTASYSAANVSSLNAEIGAGYVSKFPGRIANVQIYNTSLNATQVGIMYSEGIGASPIDGSHLAGWWPLSGNARDYSGNGNDGNAISLSYTEMNYLPFPYVNVPLNSSVLSAIAQLYANKQGAYADMLFRSVSKDNSSAITVNGSFASGLQAAHFNGQNNYINAGNAGMLQGQNFSAGTWGAWVYTTTNSVSQIIISQSAGAGQSYRLWIYSSTNSYRLSAYGLSGHSAIDYPITSSALNSWHQLIGTWNGTYLRLYWDGAPVSGPLTASGTMIASANPLDIGSMNTGTYFNGSIANVQIYNASLTANQISQLYGEGLMGAPVEASHLVGWWPLYGNADDYSGNGNTGYANGVTFAQQAYVPASFPGAYGVSKAGAPMLVGSNSNTVIEDLGVVTWR